MTLAEKLTILTDAAKYDVACTSSGGDRRGGRLGKTIAAGCCHSFSADGRCISLLKLLLTNVCVYDCQYCVNRTSNDLPRAMFTPRELADLTIDFYRRNYIEGLFLSSAVVRSPDYTTELMIDQKDRECDDMPGLFQTSQDGGPTAGNLAAVQVHEDIFLRCLVRGTRIKSGVSALLPQGREGALFCGASRAPRKSPPGGGWQCSQTVQ